MTLYPLVLPSLLLHTAYAGCRVLLALLAINLGATPLTVGLILSLLGLAPMLFAISAGRIIDRVGVFRPMLLGTSAMIGALLLAATVPSIEVLFIVSPLAGSAFVLFHIAVNHAAGVLGTPEDRIRNFSLLALTFSVSGFLGPTITGFSIDLVGHRHTFLLLAAVAAAALAAVLVLRLETPRHAGSPDRPRSRHFTDLLRDRTLRRVFIVSGALSVGWDLFAFLVPVHGSHIGLSASEIGMILGTFGAAIFTIRLLLPLISGRVSEWQMMVTAMMATGVMLMLYPLTSRVPALMLISFLLGIGLGGAQPMIMTLLYKHAPPGRGGEAVGMRTLLINFSQAGMPLMSGALGATLGMAPVFWAMGVMLVSGGCWLRRPAHSP